MAQPQGQQTISVTDLSLPQLQDVKRQLDEELTHLTSSFASLKSAQAKFRSCLDAVKEVTPANAKKTIMVPLTSSLYVPGRLSDPEKVLVDIGTGYYVSKTRPQATTHYTTKIDFVRKNLEQLQATIERKQDNLNLVLQVMQARIASSAGAGSGS